MALSRIFLDSDLLQGVAGQKEAGYLAAAGGDLGRKCSAFLVAPFAGRKILRGDLCVKRLALWSRPMDEF